MGLLDRIALSTLPLVPTPLMRKLASRYIAGERLDQAIERLAALGCEDHPGILDILGEGITSEAEAREVARDYRVATAKPAKQIAAMTGLQHEAGIGHRRAGFRRLLQFFR